MITDDRPKICYWKLLSQSTSREGEIFRSQYRYIPFRYCKFRCRGDNKRCEFYELREMSLIEEESFEDSSIRLEDISA